MNQTHTGDQLFSNCSKNEDFIGYNFKNYLDLKLTLTSSFNVLLLVDELNTMVAIFSNRSINKNIIRYATFWPLKVKRFYLRKSVVTFEISVPRANCILI